MNRKTASAIFGDISEEELKQIKERISGLEEMAERFQKRPQEEETNDIHH